MKTIASLLLYTATTLVGCDYKNNSLIQDQYQTLPAPLHFRGSYNCTQTAQSHQKKTYNLEQNIKMIVDQEIYKFKLVH